MLLCIIVLAVIIITVIVFQAFQIGMQLLSTILEMSDYFYFRFYPKKWSNKFEIFTSNDESVKLVQFFSSKIR